MAKPLSDSELHELLLEVSAKIMTARAETEFGQTSLETVRRALVMIQMALLTKIEKH